jgi:hypothetical protein
MRVVGASPDALAMHTTVDVQHVITPSGGGRVAASPIVDEPDLPIWRLNAMRAGYLLIGVGLAVVKWPVMLDHPASLPQFEGVVAAMLTAMSLLALVGLRYPVRMLPLLLFESAWKVIWLAFIGLPLLIGGHLDAEMGKTFFSVALVVVILAVIAWRFVWRQYVRAPGVRFR